MTATATPAAKCQRCHRALTSAASVARGYGRTCAKRNRQDAAVADFKPAQVDKARELIEQGGLVPLRGRRVFQVVASNGTDTYKTAAQGCTCPAARKDRLCYHRVAVALLAA